MESLVGTPRCAPVKLKQHADCLIRWGCSQEVKLFPQPFCKDWQRSHTEHASDFVTLSLRVFKNASVPYHKKSTDFDAKCTVQGIRTVVCEHQAFPMSNTSRCDQKPRGIQGPEALKSIVKTPPF